MLRALAFPALYLLLAGVATWPLALHLNTHVAGYLGFENTSQTLWLFTQWKSYALQVWAESAPAGGLLSWPERVLEGWWRLNSFAYKVSMANGLDFVPTLALEALLGTPAYYNAKALLVMALNATAAMALLRSLGRTLWAAFLGGAFFAFNPFTLYLLVTGRMVESITFWICLYTAELFRAWRGEDEVAPVRAGLWLGLQAATYWFYAHFLLLLTALFLVWHLAGALRARQQRVVPSWKPLLVGALVALAVALPAGSPYLAALLRGRDLPGGVRAGPGEDPYRMLLTRQLPTFSCNLGYGFLPAASPPGGEATPPWWLPTQHTFSMVCSWLALAGLVLWPRKAGFWGFAFPLLYLLPLGPYLKVGGAFVRLGGEPVPLPYSLLVHAMPLFHKLIFPNQAMVLWSLSAAVLAAMAAEEVGRRERARPLVGWLLAAALLFTAGREMQARGQWPIPLSPCDPAPLYASVEGATGFLYLPVNRPFWRTPGDPTPEFYFGSDLYHVNGHVAFHGRKSLWSRAQALAGADAWLYAPASLLENRLAAWLLDPSGSEPDFLPEEAEALRRAGYSHAVVLERLCSHRARGGAYLTDREEGRERYDRICQALRQRLGPEVAAGTETTWELGVDPRGPVRVTYRVALFALPRPGADR